MTIREIIPAIHISKETLDTLEKFQRLIKGESKDADVLNDLIRSGKIASISSNRFSDKQVQHIKENWPEISQHLAELIKKYESESLQEEDCREFYEFVKAKSSDENKVRDTPGARYRLLACVLPGYFCPIPDESRLNDVCRTLQTMGILNTSEPEAQDDWIKKSHALCKLLNEAFKEEFLAKTYPSQAAWNIYLRINNYKITKQMIDSIKTLVETNFNLILTGAPGTGKTHLAREIAASIIGCSKKELTGNDQFGFVQFHPSYDYTDFVEGLRPVKENGQVVFHRQDGIFKDFCAKAAQAEAKEGNQRKYVFVIDEINRGEISKIFGELFFSIDPGYRAQSERTTVKTQYQNMIDDDESLTIDNYPFKNGFYVPSNVYVIGTMNDIDRSVESMDFAFRRRFAFKEILAKNTQQSILEDLEDSIREQAIRKMDALNEAIANQEGLGTAYQIGAAYFKKIGVYNGDWRLLWDNHIRGVLFEYLRGLPDAPKILETWKTVYDK